MHAKLPSNLFMWHPLVAIGLVLLYPFLCACEDPDDGEDVLINANLNVYFNSILPYGRRTYVVITIEVMPEETDITVRLTTESYLLVYSIIGKGQKKMSPPFQKTSSISTELSKLKIETEKKVNYETGYFAQVNAIFWEIDDKVMTLLVRAPTRPWVDDYIKAYKIRINNPKPFLRLKMLKCSNPEVPRFVAVSRNLVVQTLKVKLSNRTVTTKYRWQLMDLIGESRYMLYSTDLNVLFVPRYTMRFSTKFDLWRNRFLLIVDGQFEGQPFGARCYIHVAMGQVEAVIGGGLTRRAQFSTTLIMDGSTSRDYAKKFDKQQFSKYYWNCDSYEDFRNPNCIHNISTLATFTIAPYKFKPKCEYFFRLLVMDHDNPQRNSRMVQSVTMVTYSVIQVMIHCVFNCALDMYSPQSKVRLKAKCLDCDGAELSYQWYVSGQLTLTTQDLTMYIRTVANTAVVQLVIQTADGRWGEQIKYLKKNLGPKIGRCTIQPTTGTEALTAYYPCCKNFDTRFSPVEYWYYAGRVLLSSCYDCSCEVHLPVVSEIKVLVCDSFLACCSSTISVHVEPLRNVSIESPESLWNYLNSDPHNILQLVAEGYKLRFLQTLQSTASRVLNVDTANEVVKALNSSKTCTRPSLGKLANLTLTFAHRLKPINQQTHLMLTKVLTMLNNNFACVYLHDMEYLLVEQPFINVTQGCVTVYDIMNRLSNQAPKPPKSIYTQYMKALKKGKLDQVLIDRLMDEINEFEDEDAKFRSMIWLNSMWQTERLYRFLGYARIHGLQPDENGDILSEGVALELQCFFIEPEKTYYIDTSDGMHRVEFSPDLLQELKEKPDNWICLKVISTIRELNWWYPEEKQPSSVLLSVRIFHTYDNFKVEVPLKNSKIYFTTIIGKYKPADESKSNIASGYLPMLRSDEDIIDNYIDPELQVSNVGQYINALEVGVLKYMQDVLMYRIVLEELTMLAVRFTRSTHKLHIKLTMEIPPLFSEVSASKCFIPENTTSKTVLIRNNCDEVQRAYMAVRVWGDKPPLQGKRTPVPNGPAEFAFIFQMRSCDHWIYSKPADEQHWGHDSCKPSMIVNVSRGMRCSCQVLGTYTSYVYTVPAIVVIVDPITEVKTNPIIIVLYASIFTTLLLWILWLYLYNSIPSSKTVVCEMADTEEKSMREVHDLLVQVKTGARDNALTTASVKLSFFSTQRQELQFTLMQDPEHPDLLRNTTYILWLRTRDIRIPTKIAVSHNNNGRYPSWFLHHIEVSDVQTQETQLFVVRRWVQTRILVLTSSLIFKRGDVRTIGSWIRRFRLDYEREFTNWALLQPLLGVWRETNQYPSLSRFKRACVFISKMVIVYSIIAIYTGRTTVESLQRDRAKFVRFDDWLLLSISCYLVGVLVQLFFQWMIVRYP